MKKVIVYVVPVLLSIVLFSCSKSDSTATVAPITGSVVQNLPADTIIGLDGLGMPYGANKYTFYSLEKNVIVANTDSATTKWDLAFRGTKILINGGTSGSGQGGAFIYNGLFDELTAVPVDSVFKTDNATTGTYAITPVSDKGWYHYDYANNIITPLAGRILVIKTASGKYAKVEITCYYKGGVTLATTASDAEKLSKQRYYTFKYSYQPSGSTHF